MFVITADQVNSRSTPDIVGEALPRLNRQFADTLLLPADRTAGDELQLLFASGTAALHAILDLSRTGQWSLGCGVGSVNAPLPPSVREAAGGAFIAARTAIDRAKKRPTRFAIEHAAGPEVAADAEAFLDLLLVLRSRRTPEGWELYDLTAEGLTQAEAAARLEISPQATSKRARAAELRAERAAIAPISRMLDRLGNLENTGKEG